MFGLLAVARRIQNRFSCLVGIARRNVSMGCHSTPWPDLRAQGRPLAALAVVFVLFLVGGPSVGKPSGVAAAAGATASGAPADLPSPARRFAPTAPPRQASAATPLGIALRQLWTRTSRTYLRSDGGYETQVSLNAFNYRGPDGSWQPIDNSFIADPAQPGGYRNKANDLRIQMPQRLAAPLRLSRGNAWLKLTLRDASGGMVQVDGNRASYADAFPGVSVTYAAVGDGLKQEFRLTGPSSRWSFSYGLSLAPGLTPQIERDGSFSAVDASGSKVFTFAAPFMRDASGLSSGFSSAVRYSLAPEGGGYALTLAADSGWLGSPSRQWPVVIDPSITTADCTITNGSSASTSFCSSPTLDVGFDGSRISRALLPFDLSGIPAGAQIYHSELDLYLESELNTTQLKTNMYAPAHRSTAAATWNTYDGTNAWSSAGGDYSAGQQLEATHSPTGGSIGWNWWYPTRLLEDVLDGSRPNNGILLKAENESTTQLFHFTSSDSSNSADWPYLYVAWYKRTGVRDFYPVEREQLTDRIGANVNLGNGNLSLAVRDLALNGTGLDLSLDRYWDSLRNAGFYEFYFGLGWVGTAGNGIGLSVSIDNADAALWGLDDTLAVFTHDPTDASGTRYISPPGIDATLTRNSSTGAFTLKFNSGLTYSFDSNGVLLTVSDRNGNTLTWTYDSATGTYTKITDSQGRDTTFTYTTYGSDRFISKITDPAGRIYQYGYTPIVLQGYTYYELTTYTDPKLGITRFAYDTSGNLTRVTTPQGNQTKFGYDASARVTSLTRVTDLVNDTGPTTSFSYLAADGSCPSGSLGKTQVTDPNSHTTTYCYDGQLRATKVIDAKGKTRSTGYTSNNDPSSSTDAKNQTTTFGYDANNSPTWSQSPQEGTTNRPTFAYGDTQNNPYDPTKYTDPQGNNWNYAYDTTGNMTSKSEGAAPGQNPIKFTYNANGTTKSALDAKGTQTAACPVDAQLGNQRGTYCYSYVYDASNPKLLKQMTITQPAPLGPEVVNYDSLGRVSSATDGKGQTTSYTYDDLDRVTQISFAGGSSVSFGYDGDDNQTSRTDSSGTHSYSYDALNRLTQETIPVGQTLSYSYDPASNLTSVTDASGVTQYTYDVTNLVATLTEPGGAQTSFGYDDNGDRTTIAYPNGVTLTLAYDASRRLTSIVGKNAGGSTLTSFSYSYANGSGADTDLRQSVTDATGLKTSYSYDTLNRLTQAQNTANNWQYSYDVNGNMTSKTVNGVTTNYSYNGANELTNTGYGYDANGNETQAPSLSSIVYNSQDQTTSITPTGGSSTAMGYAGVGQTERTSKGSTSYLNARLGIDREATGGTTTYYITDPDGAILGERNPVGGSGSYYFLFDGLGSVAALTNSSGSVVDTFKYDPYGNDTGTTGSVVEPLRFAGGYYDTETGLYKFGMRYYDPTIGRWTQRDVVDDPLDSHGWNRYIYAGDDPVNLVDLLGLKPHELFSFEWSGSNCKTYKYTINDSFGVKKHLVSKRCERNFSVHGCIRRVKKNGGRSEEYWSWKDVVLGIFGGPVLDCVRGGIGK
jgi:RHS repeat-associated protein